jgi:hypothetical protein
MKQDGRFGGDVDRVIQRVITLSSVSSAGLKVPGGELAVVWDLAAGINVGWWRALGARTWAAAGDPGEDDGL